jgi:hypothetical protein
MTPYSITTKEVKFSSTYAKVVCEMCHAMMGHQFVM